MDKMDALKFFFEYFDLKAFIANNNPLKLLVIACAVAILTLVAYVVARIIKKNVLKYARKNQVAETGYDSSMRDGEKMTRIDIANFNKLMRSAFTLVSLLIWGWGLRQLVIGPIYNTAVDVIFTTICTVVAIRFLTILTPFYSIWIPI